MDKCFKVEYLNCNTQSYDKCLLITNVKQNKWLDFVSDQLQSDIITGTQITKIDFNFLKKYGYRAYEYYHQEIKPENSSLSLGALIIKQELDKHKVKYKLEKTFTGCKDKHLLRFDFCIYTNNECNNFILIEYNGKQHFEYIPHFHKSYTHFLNSIKRDRIKEDFCNHESITLRKINYSDDIIYRLLDILKEFKLI